MRPTIGPTEWLETEDNPMPPGGLVRPVRTRDGVELRTAFWPATASRARGTVLLLQGRAEFIEKYFEVVRELRARGFAVATFDWRGQGLSGRALADGRKGHVRRFDDFRIDVEGVAASLLADAPAPRVVLAHSMGGCIALGAAADGWLPGERLVASTPMIGLSLVKRPRLAKALARILGALGLSEAFVPGSEARSISTLPFEGNRLSGDPVRYARTARIAEALGAGAIGSPTVGWVRAAYEAMDRLARPGLGAAIRVPTLLVGAGDDPVCSTPDIERFARTLGPHCLYVPIAGSRHEVMMETDAIRDRFWEAFDRFVAAPDGASAVQDVEDLGVEQAVAAGHDAAAGGG